MEMQNLRMAFGVGCAVLALAFCSVRAEAGQPSPTKLSQMGLAGAPIVSDSVALEVRGTGRVVVWGRSSVTGAASDHYFRVRRNFAAGATFSASGGAVAGGFSSAVAY